MTLFRSSLCCASTQRNRRRHSLAVQQQSSPSVQFLSAPGSRTGTASQWRGNLRSRGHNEAAEAAEHRCAHDLPVDFGGQDRCPQQLAGVCLKQRGSAGDQDFVEGEGQHFETESSASDDDTSSELCTWAEEEAEEPEAFDDLYGDVWPPEPSFPSDVVVVTSVAVSRNQAPGQVWEVLPHAPSVVSLSSVGSSVESTGASWEEDSQQDLFREALSECEWHDSEEASEGGSAVSADSDESWDMTVSE